jgi:flagellar hook assembly protein FlgD
MTAYQTIKSDDKSKIRISRTYLSNSGAAEIPTEGNNVLLPTTFTLHQNYPNPFNPSTKIDFDIGSANDAATRHVRLDVFNILGRRVKTLVDDNMTAGSHSVVWDATDDGGRGVATGIYLYRLEVESEHQTKKMLLLK